jgi:hypothetical protein
MTLNALIVVLGLIALLFLFAAVRGARRGRVLGALLSTLGSVCLILVAVGIVVVASSLRGYQRLGVEAHAGTLHFNRVAYHQFNGVFTSATGERSDFELRGDEWQVDARILKWRQLASLMGFSTAYRLDRISGRYTSLEDERSLPRTVYAFNTPDTVDIWELVHNYSAWIPWIDAFYGSATFLPMADGADYEVAVTQSGLIARPLNDVARTAVGGWHEP